MSKVAFLGMGVMGYPMAGHIAAAGHEVTVYNRTAAKSEAWDCPAWRSGCVNTGGGGGGCLILCFAVLAMIPMSCRLRLAMMVPFRR
jgi:hypothetical protein